MNCTSCCLLTAFTFITTSIGIFNATGTVFFIKVKKYITDLHFKFMVKESLV